MYIYIYIYVCVYVCIYKHLTKTHSPQDLLVILNDASAVRSLAPDLMAIGKLPYRGVIVSARADAGSNYDFVSRFFGPAAGV